MRDWRKDIRNIITLMWWTLFDIHVRLWFITVGRKTFVSLNVCSNHCWCCVINSFDKLHCELYLLLICVTSLHHCDFDFNFFVKKMQKCSVALDNVCKIVQLVTAWFGCCTNQMIDWENRLENDLYNVSIRTLICTVSYSIWAVLSTANIQLLKSYVLLSVQCNSWHWTHSIKSREVSVCPNE